MRKSNRSIPDHCKGIQRNGMGLLELCWEWDTKTHIQQETGILNMCINSHIFECSFTSTVTNGRSMLCAVFCHKDISFALKKSAGQRWYLKHSFFPAKVFQECVVHRGNQIWKRHVHPNVHHSTVYNSQDIETTQMPISRRMDKEAVVHIHHGILLSH